MQVAFVCILISALEFDYAYSGPSEQKSSPWSNMVTFYLGCSFGFEGSLKKAGIPVRNVEQGTNVSMYKVCHTLQWISNKLLNNCIVVRDKMLLNSTVAQFMLIIPFLYMACLVFAACLLGRGKKNKKHGNFESISVQTKYQ